MEEYEMTRASGLSGWSRAYVPAVGASALALGLAGGWMWRDTGTVHAAPVAAAARLVSVASGDSYAAVVDKVTPAVVTIMTERRGSGRVMSGQVPDAFRDFFRNRDGAQRPSFRQQGLGSGIVATADGYILTNHHVVDGADRITVELSDRRVLTARVVGNDAPSDLALLKVGASNLTPLALSDSDEARVGDIVLAVGNPLGIGQTVTAGIISAKGRTTELGEGAFQDFLQTDAPINRGNSGGALVNLQGQLVGINAQIVSPSGGNIGLGFAIPSNMVRNVLVQLKEQGHVRRARLGVAVQAVTADIAASLGLTDVRGALVSAVQPASPAAKAGLRQGDVILDVQGHAVSNSNDLRNAVSGMTPGSTVRLTVRRDGHDEVLTAHLSELVDAPQAEATKPEAAPQGQLGIAVTPVTPQIAAQRELAPSAKGMLVTEVDPNGPAAAAGLQPNDVISKVNGQDVGSVADLRAALGRAGGKPSLILVDRDGRSLFLAVRGERG
jgi:serine protease Do